MPRGRGWLSSAPQPRRIYKKRERRLSKHLCKVNEPRRKKMKGNENVTRRVKLGA